MRTAAISLATLLALLLAAEPGTATADCGGDGGGGGGGGGSAGGGSDSDSEPACEEVSDVVGHAVCRRFGAWDAGKRRPIRISAGASFHRIALGSRSFAGSADHADAPMSYRIVGDVGGEEASGGSVDLEISTALGRHLYAGIQGSAGALTAPGFTTASAAAELDVDPRSLVYLSGAAVAGAAVSVGDFRLRGELGVGVRAIGLRVETRHADCVATSTSYDTGLMVRPRVAAERWLTPWISVGANLGTNLLGSREHSVGLFIGGHLRAFDAGR